MTVKSELERVWKEVVVVCRKDKITTIFLGRLKKIMKILARIIGLEANILTRNLATRSRGVNDCSFALISTRKKLQD
jgi:hypothetical protein